MLEGAKKVQICPEWEELLHDEFAKPYFASLRQKVREANLKSTVFPSPQHIFRAFALCAPKDIRVVILGQDPYHTPGVADGLAFSTIGDNPVPPSLQNVFKEIGAEFGGEVRTNPDLTDWANQGVLLLNASLTVQSGVANSHVEFGWHEFTDTVISIISRKCEHVVFLLWGNYAGNKGALIDPSNHLILKSVHPSPLSAYKGFFGNNHFGTTNDYLIKHGRLPIDWRGKE